MIIASARTINHLTWYTAPKAALSTSDVAWNYCDMKCLQFESRVPNNDFVVVYFKNQIYKPNFAACYVQHRNGTMALWNTVTRNTFYEKYCGGDTVDWYNSGTYTVERKEGEGIGQDIFY
jgi:hypothetical protein